MNLSQFDYTFKIQTYIFQPLRYIGVLQNTFIVLVFIKINQFQSVILRIPTVVAYEKRWADKFYTCEFLENIDQAIELFDNIYQQLLIYVFAIEKEKCKIFLYFIHCYFLPEIFAQKTFLKTFLVSKMDNHAINSEPMAVGRRILKFDIWFLWLLSSQFYIQNIRMLIIVCQIFKAEVSLGSSLFISSWDVINPKISVGFGVGLDVCLLFVLLLFFKGWHTFKFLFFEKTNILRNKLFQLCSWIVRLQFADKFVESILWVREKFIDISVDIVNIFRSFTRHLVSIYLHPLPLFLLSLNNNYVFLFPTFADIFPPQLHNIIDCDNNNVKWCCISGEGDRFLFGQVVGQANQNGEV